MHIIHHHLRYSDQKVRNWAPKSTFSTEMTLRVQLRLCWDRCSADQTLEITATTTQSLKCKCEKKKSRVSALQRLILKLKGYSAYKTS